MEVLLCFARSAVSCVEIAHDDPHPSCFIYIDLDVAVFPMGSWLSFPLCGVPVTGVPAPMYGAVASVLLQLPYFKHIFAFMGCRPAGTGILCPHFYSLRLAHVRRDAHTLAG